MAIFITTIIFRHIEGNASIIKKNHFIETYLLIVVHKYILIINQELITINMSNMIKIN